MLCQRHHLWLPQYLLLLQHASCLGHCCCWCNPPTQALTHQELPLHSQDCHLPSKPASACKDCPCGWQVARDDADKQWWLLSPSVSRINFSDGSIFFSLLLSAFLYLLRLCYYRHMRRVTGSFWQIDFDQGECRSIASHVS